jgi:hypothetical protein
MDRKTNETCKMRFIRMQSKIYVLGLTHAHARTVLGWPIISRNTQKWAGAKCLVDLRRLRAGGWPDAHVRHRPGAGSEPCARTVSNS